MTQIEFLLKQLKWTDEELSDVLNAFADAIKSLELMGDYYKIVVDTLRKNQHSFVRIAEVREHTLSSDKRIIELFKYIKLEDCVHRQLYLLKARNIKIGVFDKYEKEFIGIRTKFGERRIEGEYHYDYPPYATAKPLEAIGELPESIDLSTTPILCGPLFNWLDEQEKKLNV